MDDGVVVELRAIEKLLADAALRMSKLREKTLDLDTRVFVEIWTPEVAKAAVRARKVLDGDA